MNESERKSQSVTYVMKPEAKYVEGSNKAVSSDALISKVARMDDIAVQIKETARWCPGQTLQFHENEPRELAVPHRLPKPKTISLGSRTLGFNFPSFKKRSGLKECGSGY
jgi:hypothetical protein